MPHRALSAWLVLMALLFAPAAAAQPDDEPEPEAAEEAEPDSDEGEDESDAEEGEETDDEEEAAKPEAEAAEPATVEAGAAGTAGAAAATADAQGDAEAEDDGEFPRLDLGCYLQPGFRFLVRPEARPKDELAFGFYGIAGLTVDAWPFEMWRAKLHVEFSANALKDVVTELDWDRSAAATTWKMGDYAGIELPEATAGFIPSKMFQLKAGITRIPFTLQQQSKNTELMFPTRSHPNEKFLSGSDLGAIARGDFGDGIARVSFGVFNGHSLGLTDYQREERGSVFAFRSDVNPFGEFPFGEGDQKRGPFRLGLGFGTMISPVTLFDASTGTEPQNVLDFRLSASLRMAFRGLYFVAEYFRRQQTDDFSSRPEVADGAYGQIAMFIPLGDRLGLEPIARAGFVAKDQTFDPRLIGYIDAGLNFYPVADAAEPDKVKLTLQYLGERRFTVDEEAHGGAVAVQLKF